MNKLNRSEYFKAIITGVLSTLLISWIITPATNWIFPKILHILDCFSSSFSDDIYRSIVVASDTGLILTILLISLIIFYFFIFFSIQLIHFLNCEYESTLPDNLKSQSRIATKIFKNGKKDLKSQHKTFKKISLFSYFSLGLILFSMCFIAMRQIYISGISSKAHANIEIVAPYISDQEYKEIKSNFYRIDSKDSYEQFNTRLSIIANENSLELKQ